MLNRPRLLTIGLCLAGALVVLPAAADDIFPYKVHQTTLDNGLKVVVVPYDSPGTVAYYVVVRTGSRDEVEPGHSGFAHFFEHMMFRGTERYSNDEYNDVLKKMGADSNAYTTDDRTVYHMVGPAAELEVMMDIESDRFKNLDYNEEVFRREALAVLGEYNKNISNPFLPMYERMRELAFQEHTYSHTTMGFLADIKAMPDYYDYSLSFFDRFYRPENIVVLVVGDVDPEKAFAMAKKYYGDWEKGYQRPKIATEPPQGESKKGHIDWAAPIRPYMMAGYRVPAFSASTVDTATLDLISQLLFSESALLYQQLVVDEQWVDFVSGSYNDHRDPYLFMIYSRIKSEDLMDDVQAAIGKAIADLQENPVDPEKLERIKSHLRYSFALSLDSPNAISGTVTNYLSLTGDPLTVNELYAQYQKVTPADIQRVAKEVFKPSNYTVVTLSYTEPAEDGEAIDTVTLPNPDSPIIAVRLLFKTGSIHDPAGKEGLAALTGLMVGDAGTQKRSYSELIDALYPIAASIEVETDREVTVISGEVHREKLAEYTVLLTEAVLQPAFSENDFSRNKEQALAYLTTTLRASNDELLGLEAIQQLIFADHPYQHSPAGTVEALESITVEDVKKFYRDHYTQANLMLGVAGGYPAGYVTSLQKTLGSLPQGDSSELTKLPAPAKVKGRRFTLIDKETDSVGIHIGYALPINRSNPDYYPLMVANSYLGEHRTFHGRLMQQLRGERGLNYGDYSYIEYWYVPPFTTNPTPNVPRRQQYFSVWVRPVVPETAHFALRDALFEVDRLASRGLTQEEFELARDFLINYSKLWAQTLPSRLAWHMDSRYYGMPYYIDEIDKRLQKLTVDEVNAAVKKYIQTDDFHAVLVTNNAEEVKAYLEKDQPSPMKYNAPPEQQVLDADVTIQKIEVAPTEISIVPVAEMFQE